MSCSFVPTQERDQMPKKKHRKWNMLQEVVETQNHVVECISCTVFTFRVALGTTKRHGQDLGHTSHVIGTGWH